MVLRRFVACAKPGLECLKPLRGRAFDTFNPPEVLQLPDAALEHLCHLNQLMERTGTVPATA